MLNWFNTVRKQTESILESIKSQEFITQLMDGTLPKDVFQFYIEQDALYLSEYKKILTQVGVKCTESSETQFFINAASGIIEVENALHQTFLKNHTVIAEPSPTCELYTSYLSRVVCNQSVEEGLAAVLPCFTIYKEIGDYILKNQTNKEDNPYQDWINTYGGEDFATSVNHAIDITNMYAEDANDKTLLRLITAFRKASQLEWMFWDSAYNKEQWKI